MELVPVIVINLVPVLVPVPEVELLASVAPFNQDFAFGLLPFIDFLQPCSVH